MRNQMVDDYHKKEKIDKMNLRMGKLDRIMVEKQFYNMERQKIQEELSEKKKSDIKISYLSLDIQIKFTLKKKFINMLLMEKSKRKRRETRKKSPKKMTKMKEMKIMEILMMNKKKKVGMKIITMMKNLQRTKKMKKKLLKD